MHNNYKRFTGITADKLTKAPDFFTDQTALAVVNANYATQNELSDYYPASSTEVLSMADVPYLLNDYHNHLKVVHIKSHPQLDIKIRVIKRIFDISFSLLLMALGLPVFILLYLITKFTSAGPAFFKQQRIGKNGRAFYMYKFRSMYTNAEKFGPQLSCTNDPRITSWGRLIRRTRLDELPQFWNVLKGDMAVVGPRPERQHYIDKIVQRNPDYRKLQRLKPGITSMGQVSFGYAENVDQMCTRMMYDLDYVQNVSLSTDLNVIMQTIKVMILCKGK